MKMSLRPIITIMVLAALNGCATGVTIPDAEEKTMTVDKSKERIENRWSNAEPAISTIVTNASLLVEEVTGLPDQYFNKHVSLKLLPATTLSNLKPIFNKHGLHLVIPDPDLAKQTIRFGQYDGKFGHYLEALEKTYGVDFNYHEGDIITLEKLSNFMLSAPQDKDVLSSLQEGIASLGAQEVATSVHTGTVFYKANYRNHLRIKRFLEKMSVNTALVSVQIAIINVSLNKSSASGVDWSQLTLMAGSQVDAEETIPDNGEKGDGEDTMASFSNVGTVGSNLSDLTAGAAISGHQTGINFAKGDFELNAVIDYLSQYGETEASQSLLLKTLAGKEMSLVTGQEIPYISKVTAGGTTDNGTEEQGGATIEKLNVGTTLELNPWYDAESQLVTMDIKLSISSLLGWFEVSAGNQIGKITQPQTQKHEFDDVVKLRAGNSVIIGGITYEDLSDTRNAPKFAEKWGIAHQSKKQNRNSTYVLLRPTVTVYKYKDTQ